MNKHVLHSQPKIYVAVKAYNKVLIAGHFQRFSIAPDFKEDMDEV